MSNSEYDVIAAVLRALGARVVVPPEVARAIDREIRMEFGGEKIYHARTQRAEWRDPAEMSRSTFYKWKRRDSP